MGKGTFSHGDKNKKLSAKGFRSASVYSISTLNSAPCNGQSGHKDSHGLQVHREPTGLEEMTTPVLVLVVWVQGRARKRSPAPLVKGKGTCRLHYTLELQIMQRVNLPFFTCSAKLPEELSSSLRITVG